jgi:NAD(P)-dependent dehydrogenase (short-subunit alcohol dehydrogenase family)
MNMQRLAELFRLTGRVALVTDVGVHFSADVAPLLAAAGASVLIADRESSKAEALARAIADEGGHAQVVTTDIEDESSVEALFRQIDDAHGQLDILVNCAGMTANQPLLETSMAQFDDLCSLNLRSTFMLVRDGVRLMKKGGGGRIVNITTMGTLHPVLNGNAAYGASRSGVTAMSRSIALDHAADGILCNNVLPGAIPGKTAFHPTTQAALASGRGLSGPATQERRLPLGYGKGADVAAAVLYLVGPAGSYITGQTLVLDGGFLCT